MKIWRGFLLLCCLLAFSLARAEVHSARPAAGAIVTPIQHRVSMPNVGFRLNRLYSQYRAHLAGGSEKAFESTDPLLMASDGGVVIQAMAREDGAALLRSLQKLGLRNANRRGSKVTGLLPIQAIPRAAALQNLRSILAPPPPIRNAGSYTSQGDVALRADIARITHGVDGSGVKVGVISDSFDTRLGAAADMASGDLPPVVTVIGGESGYCGSQLICVDEGRAMLQIVHDLAPGADLLFHTGLGSELDFVNAIAALEAADVDVIVDDLMYLNEPMFQDGILAQAVDAAVANGVAYYTAAGNQGRQSYEAEFVDSDVPLCFEQFPPWDDCDPIWEWVGDRHDFDPGPGVDTLLHLTIPVNSVLTVVLQWDQPFDAPQTDHDIVLLTEDASFWYDIGARDNVAMGGAWEALQYDNNECLTGLEDFYLAITYDEVDSVGPPASMVKMVFFVKEYGYGACGFEEPPVRSEFSINEHATHSGTLYGHANAQGAVAVGASAFSDTPMWGTDPPLLEPYSAAAGTLIHFDSGGAELPVPELRLKPDFVAVDRVWTTFFFEDTHDGMDGSENPDGHPDFSGTSAASPHAGALAALMLQADPTATPARIKGALGHSALEMHTPGFDYDSGYGLIQADLALAALEPGANQAPVADFSAVIVDGYDVQFTDFSSDSDGTPSNWHWDFGDGTVSVEQSPLHGFAAAGTHYVTLTVTDDAGARNAINQAVVIDDTSAPPRLLTVEVTGDLMVQSTPAGIDCGLDCSALFADGEAVTLTADPSDPATTVSYTWGGDCSGSANTCPLTMDTDKQVTLVCDTLQIPPDIIDSPLPARQCSSVELLGGMEVTGPDGLLILEAVNGISINPVFRVGHGAVFGVTVGS